MEDVHDLGGREGFGPIRDREDGAPFHGEWEMRAFGMKQSSASGVGWTLDWFRRSRELIGPADYRTRPYFDQWITAVVAEMIDEGYVSLDEIKSGAAGFAANPAVPPATAASARAFVANPKSFALNADAPARFQPGDRVRCRSGGYSGHTRAPRYARGKAGLVHAHHGGHILPDASARGEQRGEPLYTVSFAAADLWPEASLRDSVLVDLWESYLEPA